MKIRLKSFPGGSRFDTNRKLNTSTDLLLCFQELTGGQPETE